MKSPAIVALAILCLLSHPASADPADTPDQNVFVMGGPFSNVYFGETFRFWEDHYEDNFFAGVGYQHFLYEHHGGFKLGAEVGAALRLGSRSSAEIWAGAVARFDIFQIGDISITPAITAGLSLVTDTIGVETGRAADIGREVPLLYYLGPEISVSHASYPNLELFGRVQHRSGGFGTIAPIDGSNAATLGLRFKF